eukprot:282421_1
MYPILGKRDYPKTYWTQSEIIDLLEKRAKYFDEMVQKNLFDSLMVFITGHGIKDYLISSDCKKISKIMIHRIFSDKYPFVRSVPRIFLYDSCDGSSERNHLPRFYESDEEEEDFDDDTDTVGVGNIHGKGIKKKRKNPSNLTVKTMNEEKDDEIGEFGKNSNVQPNLSQQKTLEFEEAQSAWNVGEKNPDYRLVTVFAANAGYQAKMDSVSGSYLIREFLERVVLNYRTENKLYLG